MEPANILKINTLDQQWSDKDNVMLHACFQLLVDCVENEQLLDGHIDWSVDQLHIHARQELLQLYNWWRKRVEGEKQGEIVQTMDEVQYQIDDEMLIRLIKVRRFLWT
ncbi:hypothetical protein V6R21_07470 [Limibacter armeniacum]|uniref:hypothetical protein n=1 Tax=Limibacter armeniacum TaxID=466084 RepID=UPI002FE510CD